MSTTYPYSISGDTANGRVAPDSLQQEIEASSISTGVLEVISAGSSGPDVLAITFDVALSAPDIVTLTGVVGAHLGGFIPPEGEIAGWTFSVLDKDLTAPPGGPATGDLYIIPSGATGVWTGHTAEITEWDGNEWTYRIPIAGVAVWVTDEARTYVYVSDRWMSIASQYTTSASNPTTTDDSAAGYAVGTRWTNTSTRQEYVLINAAPGVADWRNLSMPTYRRTVTVGAAGNDVLFTTIKDAVTYVVAQGAGNATPWLIRVAPGSYVEANPITIPPGVIVSTLALERVSSVFVTATTATDDLFVMTGGSLIGFNLANVTDAAKSLIRVATPGQPSVVRNCSVNKCSVGLRILGGAVALIDNFSAAVAAPGIAITDSVILVTGAGSRLVANNSTFSVAASTPAFYAANPIKTAVTVELGATATLTSALFDIYPKDTDQVALKIDSGAFVSVIGGSFENNNIAVQIAAGGSASEGALASCAFDANTLNFEILSATGTLYVDGIVHALARNLVAGAQLLGTLQRRGMEFAILGNAVYEYPTTKKTTLPTFFHCQQSSGLVTGGEVTDGGGLTVDVAAGTGWVQRNGSDDDVFNVTWGASTGLALTASATNYIFYNGNSGVIVASISPPGEDNVGFAEVVTDGTGIRYLHVYTNIVESTDRRLHDYLVDTRRIVHNTGLAVAVGTTNRNIDIDVGSYYRALTSISYAGVADATFSYFYGSNAATEVASQTLVSITQYDNAGTLTAMTAGFFRSDTVILTSDGRVSVLYGTAQYATQTAAEEGASLPSVPTFMEESGFRLARLIVEEAVGIVSVVDERVSTAGGGGTGVTVHGLLSGLGADDHVQYLLVSGTRAMSGNLDMGGNSVTNVNLVDGVDVSAHGSRHNPGGADALALAAPSATAVQIGNAAAEGSAASFARSDHIHAVTGGTPVDVTKSANAAGTASTFARADHKHDVTTAAPAATGVATTSGEGSATTLARSDHTHQSNTAPVNVTKAAAGIGTSGEPARADHKHDVTTAIAVSVSTANAEGIATSLARSDHTHTVTGFSITGQVQGDILYFNGTSWVRLPPGTAGQTLTTQGGAANPSWTDPKKYPNSATDPVSPAPAAGDIYYNTTLLMQMQYDATRSKWLSLDSANLQFGRSGDLTPAGTYLRAINGMVMSATLGYDALYNGTVVGISIRRSTASASNYAVTASGVDIATLAYVAGPSVRTTASDGNFAVGDVLAARLVSDAVAPETDVQMFVRIKWRV